jgi:hypothetical protein
MHTRPSPACSNPYKEDGIMNWTLELVVVPISDIDRAKAFYTEKAGFLHPTRMLISRKSRCSHPWMPFNGA